ncbi:hypothetical protein [Leptospira santarosai]|uniref:hypothetical protein n=1 Tax=Leptospira santarosai TaxID=28183 RepID=UPI0012BB0F19|nr:hypothetical protein [Leptospira santarosai]
MNKVKSMLRWFLTFLLCSVISCVSNPERLEDTEVGKKVIEIAKKYAEEKKYYH